jgi:hypothetical protein
MRKELEKLRKHSSDRTGYGIGGAVPILAQEAAEGGLNWVAVIPAALAVLPAVFTLVKTMVERQPIELDDDESSAKLPVVSMTGDSPPVLGESGWKSMGLKATLVAVFALGGGLFFIILGRLGPGTNSSVASGIFYSLWGYVMLIRTVDLFFRLGNEQNPWQSEKVLLVEAVSERDILSICIRILERMHAEILRVDEGAPEAHSNRPEGNLVAGRRLSRNVLQTFTNPTLFFLSPKGRKWAEEIEIHVSCADGNRYQMRIVSRSIIPVSSRSNENNVQNFVRSLIA